MSDADENASVAKQLEDLLKSAHEELSGARMQRQFVEELLSQIKDIDDIDKRSALFENAEAAVLAAETANLNIRLILQQAHDLVKSDEESPDRSFMNIKEIKELKEFRDIVNAEGEAAEEAFAARKALEDFG